MRKEVMQDQQQRQFELDEYKSELVGLKTQLETSQQNVSEMSKQEKDASSKINERKESCEEKERQLEEKKKKMMDTDKQFSRLNEQRISLERKISDLEIELKKIDGDINRSEKTTKESTNQIQIMEQKNPWIEKEKHLFGKAKSEYDFNAKDVEKVGKELKKLQEEQTKLAKNLNRKVMAMFEKAEQEFKDLVSKRETVEKDKQKIEEVIKQLDIKKNEAIQKAFEKVNADFKSIFSSLLPGTEARLAPPNAGDSVLDGLDMKVAFGGVVKESLTELSGGQRSLLALSLILAILRFKPAPMYILDEIDAALDISNTANIGTMLQKHFQSSQFIIISLKDEMFKNANVLFQTEFVDGISRIKRIKNKPAEKKYNNRQRK